MTERRGWN